MHAAFENTFIINLKRRPDRLSDILSDLSDKANILHPTVVEAIDGKTLDAQNYNFQSTEPLSIAQKLGHIGCTLSHLKVLQRAMYLKLPFYAVFEDDAVLHPFFNTLFREAYETLPAEVDCVFLGGSHVGGFDRLNAKVIKMFGSYTTHAMLIYQNFYEDLYRVWSKVESEVDVAMASLHAQHDCYAFNPPLAWQRAGYSDILQKDDDYQHLKKIHE